MGEVLILGMDQILVFLISLGLLSFSGWVFFTTKDLALGRQLSSGAMFIIVLLILWRVFKLNLDFGLVLTLATFFAGISWLLGLIINLKSLEEESKSYFWILLLILCLRSFFYEPYQIPSSSMEPGLQIGDFVLVNKFAYGLKLPAINKSINDGPDPKRGDVAVFLPPHSLCGVKPEEARPELATLPFKESQIFIGRFLSLQKSRCTKLGIKYIKRVIGIPGDKVEIKGYEIYINNKKLNMDLKEINGEESLYFETIGKKQHLIRTLGMKEYENFTWTIPPERYLAIGDNRDNSLDSRAWGYFSKEHLIGKGEFIWLHWGSFSEFPHFKRNKRIK